MLLHNPNATVELRRLLADLGHLTVQSIKHPYKPTTKNEDQDNRDRTEDHTSLAGSFGRRRLILLCCRVRWLSKKVVHLPVFKSEVPI